MEIATQTNIVLVMQEVSSTVQTQGQNGAVLEQITTHTAIQRQAAIQI